jgi:hypothetical protein
MCSDSPTLRGEGDPSLSGLGLHLVRDVQDKAGYPDEIFLLAIVVNAL